MAWTRAVALVLPLPLPEAEALTLTLTLTLLDCHYRLAIVNLLSGYLCCRLACHTIEIAWSSPLYVLMLSFLARTMTIC